MEEREGLCPKGRLADLTLEGLGPSMAGPLEEDSSRCIFVAAKMLSSKERWVRGGRERVREGTVAPKRAQASSALHFGWTRICHRQLRR